MFLLFQVVLFFKLNMYLKKNTLCLHATLKKHIQRAKIRKNNRMFVWNLMIDYMSIRRYVEWAGKRYVEYVDFGADLESDALLKLKKHLFSSCCYEVQMENHSKILLT